MAFTPNTFLPLLAALAAYLIGSLSFAVIVSRVMGLNDPRTYGSRNPGATNVLRSGSKAAAVLTLLRDALKGYVPVALVVFFGSRHGLGQGTVALVALGAFLGHLWPVYFRFKGGKGVATFLGILLGLHWPTMILTAVIWIGTAALTRYSSLSALIAAAAAPVVLLLFGRTNTALLVAILAVIVWARHKDNLKRLMAGEEARIGRA